MAHIVAILNSKGGTGKTTLSTNVAGCIHRQGYSVLLIDSDPQGSALDWLEVRPDDVDLPEVVAMDRPVLHKNVPRLSRPYDFVLIDGAAKLEDMTTSAVKAADFVLIPVQHSGLDMRALDALVDAVHMRRELTEGRPDAAFVISRQAQGTRMAHSVDGALKDYGLDILKARTTQRIAYQEAGTLGVTVFDLDGKDKAVAEIEAITNELLARLNKGSENG